MPSPLGHALAGLTAGWLVAAPVASARRDPLMRSAALFAMAGALPDIDLLFGAHSGPTHGIGAAIIAGLAGFLIARDSGFAIAIGAAYASHILLDWLGSDTSAPIGIMALWPFSRDYYESDAHVFMAISRRYWLPEFWAYNFKAVGRELLILGPIAAGVYWLRSRRP